MAIALPTSFDGARVLVVGLGRLGGGVAVTRWLAEQGAKVTVTDQAPKESLSASISQLQDISLKFDLGGHTLDLLDSCDLAILNPAVMKSRSELFQEMTRRELPWTTEINLFCERCPAPVLAVTGSYGKSTTATMLTKGLRACVDDKTIFLGGNIGVSLLPKLPSIRADDLVVLELSNAQLEDLPGINWAPKLAILTNIHPHHLDRYATYQQYIETKFNVLGTGAHAQALIVGDIDDTTQPCLSRRLASSQCTVIDANVNHTEDRPRANGAHNLANATCAMEAIRYLGYDMAKATKAISTFKGLPHRLEHVRTVRGVSYINDSKSTAPDNTITACETMTTPCAAIIGGKNNGDDFSHCARIMASTCKMVLCVGESAQRFAGEFVNLCHNENSLDVRVIDQLDEAVRFASERTVAGDTVLFSPGAPSFDLYVNFEHRGDVFADVVNALPE